MKRTHAANPASKATPVGGALGSRVSFSIRPARKTDLEHLLAMIHELAAFEHLEKEVEATLDSLEEALFGPDRAACALMATAGGDTVGYAIYYQTFSSFAGRRGIFLDDVYVRPAWRKSGVGRALLERTALVGKELNCGRFEWIALRWNRRALNFYKKLGAVRMNEWVLLRMGHDAMAGLASGVVPSAPGNKPAGNGGNI
jgi:GNAT superfamily N-acetyltransferase